MRLTSVKSSVLAIVGILGGALANILGGWDMALETLLIFMAIDYATGLIVAGVFHKSRKSDTGALESKAGWKGICKKGVTLMFVIVGHRVDLLMATDTVRYGIIIAFSVNEFVSITENAGLMGIPLPNIVTQALDLLRKDKATVAK